MTQDYMQLEQMRQQAIDITYDLEWLENQLARQQDFELRVAIQARIDKYARQLQEVHSFLSQWAVTQT